MSILPAEEPLYLLGDCVDVVFVALSSIKMKNIVAMHQFQVSLGKSVLRTKEADVISEVEFLLIGES